MHHAFVAGAVDLAAYAFFLIGPLLALQVISSGRAFWRARQDGVSCSPAAQLARAATALLFPLFLLVLVGLSLALISNDFDLLFVAQNTNPATPLLYKVVGVWGNHEGSLVLWQATLALFALLMGYRPAAMPGQVQALALAIMGALIAAFYGFSAWLANPFAGNGTLPPGSGDLNVLLQDLAQAIHPPLLYLGYAASAVVFALASALLISRRVGERPQDWAAWLRPWALVSWTFLTAGITLGSFWAYYELGWGGWWFWDPVENLALLPWLLATALIHSLQVVRVRRELLGWTVLLALLTFVMVMLATFIVRSGLLTSVHAFAADPGRGLYLLVLLLVLVAGGGLAFVYGTAGGLPGAPRVRIDRAGALLLNNLMLMALFAAVFAGTLAPSLIEILGGELYVVRARFYVRNFVWPGLGLLALMAAGIWLNWGRPGIAHPIWVLVSLGGALALYLVLIVATDLPLRAGLMVALGLWLVLSSALAWGRQIAALGNRRAVWAVSPARHGWALAHMGLGVAVVGMSAAALFPRDIFFEYQGQEQRQAFGAEVTLQQRLWVPGENFHALVTPVYWQGRGLRLAETRLYHPAAPTLDPARDPSHRAFLAEQGRPATEAALFRGWLFDLFITVQDRTGGPPLVQISQKFGITWIWLGAGLMTLGGVLALLPRWRLVQRQPSRGAHA